ncbi:Rsp5p-dependent ubiquitination, sorting of cargo proteins at the multivesicular body [Gonapodya sp. JEL0774]|nr:Rsp5p-dependent ubiquitination, sorting of cargo proteins at the multivesicular body [Gonapodya sp. JEL0774]
MDSQGVGPDTGRGPVPAHLITAVAERNSSYGPGAAWRFAPIAGTEAASRVSVEDKGKGKSVLGFAQPPSWQTGDTDVCVLTDLPLWYLEGGDIRPPFFYFEITVVSATPARGGAISVIAIGVSTSPYPPFRLPGWHAHSVAYHSDDGRLFVSDPFGGRPYGPAYGPGDVIGVGYYPPTGATFFTRNGQLIPSGTGTPTVGWDGSAIPNDGCYSVVWGEKTVHAVVGCDGWSAIEADFSGPFRYPPGNPGWWVEAVARGWSAGVGGPVVSAVAVAPPSYTTVAGGGVESQATYDPPPKY